MTYNVFDGTLNLAQSINQSIVPFRSYRSLLFKFWPLRFEPPFEWGGGVTGNVRCSSQAYWKARSGLSISVI